MFIKQISVFVENKPGKVACLTNLLAKNNIDIKAMTIADSQDFGIIRLIVDNPAHVLRLIKDNGFTAKETDVFACEVTDTPGGLSNLLKKFQESNIAIEYLYSYVHMKGQNAIIIIRTHNNPPEGIKLLSEKELFAL